MKNIAIFIFRSLAASAVVSGAVEVGRRIYPGALARNQGVSDDAEICFRAGRATCQRGKLLSRTLAEVQAVLGDAGVRSATVKIKAGRIKFPTSLPANVCQRVRNVILNC